MPCGVIWGLVTGGEFFAFLQRNGIYCASGSGILAVADSRVGEGRETGKPRPALLFTPQHLVSTSPPKHIHKQHNTHSLGFDHCAALLYSLLFSYIIFDTFLFDPHGLNPGREEGTLRGKQPSGGQEQQHRPGIGGLGVATWERDRVESAYRCLVGQGQGQGQGWVFGFTTAPT